MAAKKQRTLENTGTCSVCFNNIKRCGNGLARHGYVVKYGFFDGHCNGERFLPFELSNAGTMSQLELLWSIKKQIIEKLDGADDIESIPQRPGEKPVLRGDGMWNVYIHEYKNRIKGDLRQVESDIVFFTKAVAQWEPQALPG